MKISIIVAASSNMVIGNKNLLPWHLPADLKHFKKVTMGHPIIMGRKTYESIGKPLPGRTNMIITRQVNYEVPGCIVVNSLDEAIGLCKKEEEVFVIGGAEIIVQALPKADKIYLTRIHHDFEGDVFLPVLQETKWHEVSRMDFQPDEKNDFSYSFLEFEKIPVTNEMIQSS